MLVSQRDQFARELDYGATEHRKTFVIASTGRSGSHLVGRTLHASGAFGLPLEYLHPSHLALWGRRSGKSDAMEIVRDIIAHRTGPNGVFGIKIHNSHLRSFPDLQGLFALLGDTYAVHLVRDDLAAQAVSYSIAVQTGEWISGMSGNGREARYDEALILRCLREIIADNAAWSEFLARNSLPNRSIRLSEFQADIPSTVSSLAQSAGIAIDQAALPQTPATRKQGGSRNGEWTQRFKSETITGKGIGYSALGLLPRTILRRLLRRA